MDKWKKLLFVFGDEIVTLLYTKRGGEPVDPASPLVGKGKVGFMIIE